MDTSTWGKILRISLIVTLASTILTSFALMIAHGIVSILEASKYIDYSAYMPLLYRIACVLPICTLAIISIILVSLQTKRILALEKLVLKADDIPNNYRSVPPCTQKSKRPRAVKIIVIAILAIVLLICILGSQAAIIRTVLEIILNPDVPDSEMTFFVLEIIVLILYALLFILIGISTVLGGACIFIGGRSSHVDELERVLVQKSNYAELRAREENDDYDELSQIF